MEINNTAISDNTRGGVHKTDEMRTDLGLDFMTDSRFSIPNLALKWFVKTNSGV